MSKGPHVSPLTEPELALILRPENAELHEAYGDVLGDLHEMAARHSGSGYFILVPDEAEARAILQDDLARLERFPSFAARMRCNLAAVESLRTLAERYGEAKVRSAATELMAELTAEHQRLYQRNTNLQPSRHAVAG